jgi:hypothetical protein
MISVSLEPDDRGERQRLVDHLQDRHGPGPRFFDAATLDHLSREHERLHNARDGAGYWPGGSEGPHKMDDLTSWDDTKRLRMHLGRTHRMEADTCPEPLAKLRDLHDRVHDDAYRHRSPDELDPQKDHDRSDLT